MFSYPFTFVCLLVPLWYALKSRPDDEDEYEYSTGVDESEPIENEVETNPKEGPKQPEEVPPGAQEVPKAAPQEERTLQESIDWDSLSKGQLAKLRGKKNEEFTELHDDWGPDRVFKEVGLWEEKSRMESGASLEPKRKKAKKESSKPTQPQAKTGASHDDQDARRSMSGSKGEVTFEEQLEDIGRIARAAYRNSTNRLKRKAANDSDEEEIMVVDSSRGKGAKKSIQMDTRQAGEYASKSGRAGEILTERKKKPLPSKLGEFDDEEEEDADYVEPESAENEIVDELSSESSEESSEGEEGTESTTRSNASRKARTDSKRVRFNNKTNLSGSPYSFPPESLVAGSSLLGEAAARRASLPSSQSDYLIVLSIMKLFIAKKKYFFGADVQEILKSLPKDAVTVNLPKSVTSLSTRINLLLKECLKPVILSDGLKPKEGSSSLVNTWKFRTSAARFIGVLLKGIVYALGLNIEVFSELLDDLFARKIQ